MARARNIKPGFFKNELLVTLEPFDRLLFIGLWCLADREGRIEDRPKKVKMELFPCDTYDVDAGLSLLQSTGFIERYEVNNVKVVLINNFLKHQTPHGTEKDSELPDKDGELTLHERDSRGYVAGVKRVNNVKSDKFNEGITSVQRLEHVNPPLVNALIPDSLIPESKPLVSHNKIVFDGSSFQNINGQMAVWQKAYPALNIESELNKAAAWIVSNPKNIKTQWGRFLNGWFSRAQDKAPRQQNGSDISAGAV